MKTHKETTMDKEMARTERELTYDDLEPTLFEREQQRHEIVTAQNERRERIRLRKANDKAGHAEPKAGMTIYVQLDGSVTKRNRAGIRFERGTRVAVKVIDEDKVETTRRQQTGELVVNIEGAERIFEDKALHVFEQPGTPEDFQDLRARNDSLEIELQTARAELQSLRSARMGAKDTDDGRPNRLIAAREAQTKGQTKAEASASEHPGPGQAGVAPSPRGAGGSSPSSDANEFGGPPTTQSPPQSPSKK